MKFRNSSVPFDLAQPKSIQAAAIAVGVSASSAAASDASLAQFLSKKRRALLTSFLRAKGYTGVDETDPDWVVPVRDETIAHVRTHYTGNKLLNRLVFAINARFGSKGYLVDPDGHIAVLLRHPSTTSAQMYEDIKAVIRDSRMRNDLPSVSFTKSGYIPIWNCILIDSQPGPRWPNGDKSIVEVKYIKYSVQLHAVLDTAGPAIYIEWEKA